MASKEDVPRTAAWAAPSITLIDVGGASPFLALDIIREASASSAPIRTAATNST